MEIVAAGLDDLARIAELAAGLDAELQNRFLHERANALYTQGKERGDNAALAEALVAQLAGAATVVAYSSYELTCIRSLIDAVPDQQPALERILALPWVDLLKIVQGHY